MTVPRFLTASAVAAGLAFGSAGVVMAASGSPSPSSASEASPSPSPSASSTAEAVPDDSPSPSPSLSFGDDVPPEVIAGFSEIPQSDAVAIAQAAVGADAGQLERAVLKLEDGRLVWDLRFSSDSKVEVDAFTGDVLKVDVGGATQRNAGEPGDDNGGDRGPGAAEAGDDNGGHHGNSGSGESGDDNGGGSSGHSGSDD
jgi:uncharacterized membrane protein YgcG